MTNAGKLSSAPVSICEWSPERRGLAYLSDEFHDTAELVVEGFDADPLRVCAGCAAVLSRFEVRRARLDELTPMPVISMRNKSGRRRVARVN